jgi:hypothetical protein
MEQNIKPCKCGSLEFITKPNQYDVYQIIDNKLELIDTLFTDEEIKLFCRECSEEIDL